MILLHVHQEHIKYKTEVAPLAEEKHVSCALTRHGACCISVSLCQMSLHGVRVFDSYINWAQSVDFGFFPDSSLSDSLYGSSGSLLWWMAHHKSYRDQNSKASISSCKFSFHRPGFSFCLWWECLPHMERFPGEYHCQTDCYTSHTKFHMVYRSCYQNIE